MAIALTVLALVLILPWEENYGGSQDDDTGKNEENKVSSKNEDGAKEESFSSLVRATLSYMFSHKVVLCLGLSQALFEGAVYTFGELLKF